ncbi:26S proteasome regulatory subunit 10B-like isoform X2 [Microplitis mediator]|uniref:26S proteasome regulatory subunit 10B-like isoform X2 n=1 Tax=Microplitis mediator TaxID=375433 RepID=UPI0025569CED|nr:26S proteasome regulatory subunit 10B-like isoform X2 [Microplitis mediator]
MAAAMDPVCEKSVQDDREKLMEHKETESPLKENLEDSEDLDDSEDLEDLEDLANWLKQYDESENEFEAEESESQTVGEALEEPTDHEKPGNVTYADIGGLSDQILELQDVIEYDLIRSKFFKRSKCMIPKGYLLYGPPGTGKTLLVQALASQLKANFIKVVSSDILDKSVRDPSGFIYEIFTYAIRNQPCIIFMDEIDAIGRRRLPEGTKTTKLDRKNHRTLMELLKRIDGIGNRHRILIIATTNKLDTLDEALLSSERLSRKIEIPLPNEEARLEILKIYAPKTAKEFDYEAIVKLTDGFNGVDLRNVCTVAGYYAIHLQHSCVTQEDFMKAIINVSGPNPYLD